ncbi:hypothetical protein BC628DRAFT_486680 [Trametes gibbosa]|nr:hypothetical protein BC628DRAFT_486680 [Trametes gibbosa]
MVLLRQLEDNEQESTLSWTVTSKHTAPGGGTRGGGRGGRDKERTKRLGRKVDVARGIGRPPRQRAVYIFQRSLLSTRVAQNNPFLADTRSRNVVCVFRTKVYLAPVHRPSAKHPTSSVQCISQCRLSDLSAPTAAARRANMENSDTRHLSVCIFESAAIQTHFLALSRAVHSSRRVDRSPCTQRTS